MALSMSTSVVKLHKRKTGVESFSLSNTQNVTRSAETARVNKSDSRAKRGFRQLPSAVGRDAALDKGHFIADLCLLLRS